MKQPKRIKTYIEQVEKIGTAIDRSDGTMKNIAELSEISLASAYRYCGFDSRLKTKLYIAKIKNLYKLIEENRTNIKRMEKEFYSTEKVRNFLFERSRAL